MVSSLVKRLGKNMDSIERIKDESYKLGYEQGKEFGIEEGIEQAREEYWRDGFEEANESNTVYINDLHKERDELMEVAGDIMKQLVQVYVIGGRTKIDNVTAAIKKAYPNVEEKVELSRFFDHMV